MALETDHNTLYFLESYNKYKQGKINLLSSKSGILICREKIKRIIQLRELDEEYRRKIVKNISSLILKLKKFNLGLPRTKESDKKRDHSEISKRNLKKRQTHYQDEIKGELAEINKKLIELTA